MAININRLLLSTIMGASVSTGMAAVQPGPTRLYATVAQSQGLRARGPSGVAEYIRRPSTSAGRPQAHRRRRTPPLERGARLMNIGDQQASSGRSDGGDTVSGLSQNFGFLDKIGVGKGADATLDGDIAIGVSAKADGGDSLAMSRGAQASGGQSIAIGVGAHTARNGRGSVAIGRGAAAEHTGDIALGNEASAAGGSEESISSVSNHVVSFGSALAIGEHAAAKGADDLALGGHATAFDRRATALGSGAEARGNSSLAVGSFAVAAAHRSVALGADSRADRPNTVSVGTANMERQVVNVAAGSRETDAVNVQQLKDLGASFKPDGTASNGFIAYDDKSATSVTLRGAAGSRLTNLSAGVLTSDSSDAVTGAQLFHTNESVKAVSDGMLDVKTSVDAIAKGGAGKYFSANSARSAARAAGADALAIGAESSARGEHAIAIGLHAHAESNNAIALGSDSVADRANAVSVGNQTTKRQITNVADGTDDTDAVNLSQLRKVGLIDKKGGVLDAVVYDAGSHRSSITLGGVGATSAIALTNVSAGRISAESTDAVNGSQLFALSSRVDKLEKPSHLPKPTPDDTRSRPMSALDAGNHVVPNVAAGIAKNDAVNVGQLNAAMKAGIDAARAHTDSEVARVRTEMDHDRKDASGGSASAIAIANLPQAYPGESMLSVASGTFGGQSSVALGLSTATDRWSFKVSFSGNTRGSYGGGAGAGYRF